MDPELQQAFAQLEGRLGARIDGVETRLKTYIEERSEATETKLLSAFHNWAQTFEVRARGTSAAVREFDERLGLIEERVAKLERSKTSDPKERGGLDSAASRLWVGALKHVKIEWRGAESYGARTKTG